MHALFLTSRPRPSYPPSLPPTQTTENELEALFSSIGPLLLCYIRPKRSDRSESLTGLVRFEKKEDATAAVTKLCG